MPGLARRTVKPEQSSPAHPLTDSFGPGGRRPISSPTSQSGPGSSSSDASLHSDWGQAIADEVAKVLPEGLSEEDVSAAQNWASGSEGPGTNIIGQLQAHLGVAPTGQYTRDTVVAVFNDQQARNQRGAVGVASPSYMGALGLIFTQDVVAAEVDDALAASLQTDHSDGYAVAFYVHYDNQNNNNREFGRQAVGYAARTAALGLEGGSVVQGLATPIEEGSEIIEGLQSIYQGVRGRYIDGLDPYAHDLVLFYERQGGELGGPSWTKANDVALFCHGMPGGLSTDAGGSYSDGLHGDTFGPSNIESFVNGVRGATTADVNVQLFACGAGRGTDEEARWLEHRQDHRMGQESVAQELSTHLGDTASVFAHTTTGHTTENYAARTFGAEAGGGEGGLHMFDRLFPESFIQSELLRIYPALDPAQLESRHDPLRERMWDHYRRSIGSGISIDRFGAPMGQLMFQDPNRAAELLQGEWQGANPSR